MDRVAPEGHNQGDGSLQYSMEAYRVQKNSIFAELKFKLNSSSRRLSGQLHSEDFNVS